MPPYSNRPQYGEPMPLGTGDFESVSGPNSVVTKLPAGFPRPGRMPELPQQPSRSSIASVRSGTGNAILTGRGYNTTGPFPPAPGSIPAPAPSSIHSNRHVPHAPHSLTPVAMASSRSSVATGPQAIVVDAHPSRPSAKAGMSILFAGAIIGGLIGAVMHARQNAAMAFDLAVQQHDVAANVAPIPSPLPGVDAKPADDGKMKLSAPIGDDKKTDDKKSDDKKAKGGKGKWVPIARGAGPTKTTTASADTSTTDVTALDVPAKGAKSGKKSSAAKTDDDGYTVASAGGDGDSAPAPKPAAPEKPAKKTVVAEKPEKAEKPDPAPAKKPAGKSDDAVNVLRAAMGATENTL